MHRSDTRPSDPVGQVGIGGRWESGAAMEPIGLQLSGGSLHQDSLGCRFPEASGVGPPLSSSLGRLLLPHGKVQWKTRSLFGPSLQGLVFHSHL